MPVLSPSILFPPSPDAPDALSAQLPGDALCITGPLPASCLYHVALNHLRIDALPAFPSSGATEAPATPFEKPHVLIITPDRTVLHTSMVNEPDAWLAMEGGKGDMLKLLDMIGIKSVLACSPVL